MKLDHHFLLMICVLFCAQIIQADLIHGLLGFGEKNTDNGGTNNTGGSVSSPSSSNTPNTPSLPEPSHLVNNNNDTPNINDNNNTPVVSKLPSPSVESPSPTIPPLSSNFSPSPLSPPATPVTSNMENSGPGTNVTPDESNKNLPFTTPSPKSSTKEANDTPPNKGHSYDGGSSAGNPKNNDSKDRNNNSEVYSNSDINAKTTSTETEDSVGASSTPESNPHSNIGTVAGAVVGGIVGLALIGGMATWCNRKGGCTKRQKHGVRDGGFNQKDNYSIDMHPHARTKNSLNLPTPAGIVEMTPASPFEHSRCLVAGASTVPAYTDSQYHEQYEVQQSYSRHEGDGTGYYYDAPQQHLNYGEYYSSDTYKPDAMDNHKPNAI